MSDRIYHNMPEQPKDDITDRALHLSLAINDTAFVDEIEYGVDPTASIPIHKVAEMISSALQREHDLGYKEGYDNAYLRQMKKE
jgi:hypothetical protein